MKEPQVLEFPASIPPWLLEHPALQPWEKGWDILNGAITHVFERYSSGYYDLAGKRGPCRSGDRLSGRLFACWAYHWGKKNRSWTPEESREYVLNQMSFHPLEDVVFSDAIYERQDRAAIHFQKTMRHFLRRTGNQLLKIMQFPCGEMDDWLDEFWVFLLDESKERSCVILRYMGLIPIRRWLQVVFTNYVNNEWRKKKNCLKFVFPEGLSALACDPYRINGEEEKLAVRFADFLALQLRDALQNLSPEDRMRLEYAYLQGMTVQQTATILQESHSASYRRRVVAEGKLCQELANAIRNSSDWSEYAEFFSKKSPALIMKWMFGKE